MINKFPYDYAIIGGGLAGMQLAHAFMHDPYFRQKRIVIIEASEKKTNDRSWSFWEKGEGKWDDIVYKKWSTAYFNSDGYEKHFSLAPYAYKMIPAINFYNKIKNEIEQHVNVNWIQDRITAVTESSPMQCKGEKDSYSARKVFDSRLTENYKNSTAPFVLQHFVGQFINSSTAVFNPNSFTIMDFSIGHKNQCAFMYVLPFNQKRALVEYTFFNSTTYDEEVYEKKIHQYIKNNLRISDYSVERTEKGVIPMSSHDFGKENRKNYLKIGTAGGWVKAASGYSFKNTENKVRQLLKNIKSEQALDHQMLQKRFQFYDRIFLSLLQEENRLGSRIFKEMYSRNKIQDIFAFLDEESKLIDEINIIRKFNPVPFLRALKRTLF